MAVGRINADGPWFRYVAGLTVDHPQLTRELIRAADHPSLNAELTGREARVLAELLPEDPRVTGVLEMVKRAEQAEILGARRTRGRP